MEIASPLVLVGDCGQVEAVLILYDLSVPSALYALSALYLLCSSIASAAVAGAAADADVFLPLKHPLPHIADFSLEKDILPRSHGRSLFAC